MCSARALALPVLMAQAFWPAALAPAAGVAAAVVRTGAPPAWVESVPAPRSRPPTNETAPGGQAFRLVDRQVSLGASQTFVHVAKDVLDQTGLQEGANLSFQFDPSYQQLTVHSVDIVRGDQRLDALNMEALRVVQRENDLERQIYDGTVSALLFLEGVRVGDSIEYAFTLTGSNPVLKDWFASSVGLQSSVRVRHLRYRLLVPAGRKVYYKNHGTTLEPRIRSRDKFQEYIWEARDAAPTVFEDDVPSWVPVYPWVQLTEFASWRQVVDWALPLYAPTSDAPAIREKIGEIQNAHGDAEAQIHAALSFVQNQIRYLGIELGPESWQPREPGKVLERRFGDCKDKALLLCTLLRGLGHEAVPVLVGTGYRQAIADQLPWPFAFDHVIVRVQAGGQTWWVDPTRDYQRAPLGQRFLPLYGFGLAVRSGESALTPIPANQATLPETVTLETFHVRGQKEAARLEVVTEARSADAEGMRAVVASMGLDRLAKSWVNDYAQTYPGIALADPPTLEDVPGKDLVIIRHAYVISNFWALSEDSQARVCAFAPTGIRYAVQGPDTRLRTYPIEVTFPRRRVVHTTVKLPEDWPLTNYTRTMAGPASTLKVGRRVDSGTPGARDFTFTMEYEYTAQTNWVPLSQVPEHLRTLKQMDNELGYSLSWQDLDVLKSKGPLNWPILAMASVYGSGLLLAAALVYRRISRPRSSPPLVPELPPDPRLTGLGGWLVLVGIGIVLTPFSVLRALLDTASSYSPLTWHSLTAVGGVNYHPGWAPILIFELLGNLTSLGIAVLLVVLYYQKRRSFPRWYIGFMAFNVALVALDYLGALLMKEPLLQSGGDLGARELVRAVLGACIWIPYMLTSRRVKLTFVR